MSADFVTSDQNLSGLTAVVTGASSGIGAEIARELASAGAAVLIHARRSAERLQQVAGEVAARGVPCQQILADLADPDGQDALVRQAWDWRDGVDIWVNNAGADMLTGEPASWPFEQKLRTLFEVDVMATLRISRAIGARMKQRGRGVILNMGWDQAAHGMGGDSGELFAASKGAIMAFTKSLAVSLAPEVRVNCLAPGWIKTAWGENASDEWQRRAVRESQLGRWGLPADIARAARFLASPEASFITGQVLPVNGGLRAV